MKKVLIISVFVLTIGIGVAAVYLGSTLTQTPNLTPDKSKAESPINCQLDLTQANPKADINMGKANDGPYPIPEYCPGEIGKIKATKAGKIIVYTSNTDLVVKINDQTYPNTEGTIITDKIIAVNDYFTVSASLNDEAGIGWVNPAGVSCGDPVWETVSLQPLLDKATQDGNTVIEKQCWGDAAKGQSDFDFSNFQIVIAIEGVEFTPIATTLNLNPTKTISNDSGSILSPVGDDEDAGTISNSSNVKKECGASNTCNTDDNCTLGSVCADIGGSRRCVADICLTDGKANSVCQPDLCTPQNEIKVDKEVVISCLSGLNEKQLSYTVILTNPEGNQNLRSNLSVVDTLDPEMQPEFVIKTSIPYGGLFENGAINWHDLELTPDNGRLEIKYQVNVPPSEYGKEYRNSVIVSEGGVVRGSKTISTVIEILPCTALISDQVDVIIFGIAIIVIGLLMYKTGLDQRMGNFLWNRIGRGLVFKFSAGDINHPLLRQDKKDFETKLERKIRRKTN